jgi:hypothetical protein
MSVISYDIWTVVIEHDIYKQADLVLKASTQVDSGKSAALITVPRKHELRPGIQE